MSEIFHAYVNLSESGKWWLLFAAIVYVVLLQIAGMFAAATIHGFYRGWTGKDLPRWAKRLLVGPVQ